MTDDLELRLRDTLAAIRLPSAPPSLSHLLAELATEAVAEPVPRRRRMWVRLAALATVSIGIVAFTSTTLLLSSNAPNAGPATPPSPSPSGSPNSPDGSRAYTVSELEEAMVGPNRPSGTIALQGFWTDRSYAFFCNDSPRSETNLELGCDDGMYGITELNEPITDDGQRPRGASLTPWIPDYAQPYLRDPALSSLPYPPIPIVVTGHIDDPRAAECAPNDRQKCLDRFVIESIEQFDLWSVPVPSPSLGSLEGLHVYEVGELEEAIAGADRPTGPIALRGYWTNRSFGHSCAPPREEPGELALYCSDGEWGITERNEPIITFTQQGQVFPATGPALTPWVPPGFQMRLFVQPFINDQPYPPVPIIVVGHIEDPGAADCAEEFRQRCLDRFVIDNIVSFDPAAVPTPAPTPSPTPFPFEDPPPALIQSTECEGVTEVEFIGWTTKRELGFDGQDADEPVYAVVGANVMPMSDWATDKSSGRQFRHLGRRICYGHESDGVGAILLAIAPGSAVTEWEDGTITPDWR